MQPKSSIVWINLAAGTAAAAAAAAAQAASTALPAAVPKQGVHLSRGVECKPRGCMQKLNENDWCNHIQENK
eukprot:141266-Pelagomonas_calceolata.AAC.1